MLQDLKRQPIGCSASQMVAFILPLDMEIVMTINTAASFDKNLPPSVVFGSFSLRMTAEGKTKDLLDAVIPKVLDFLWTNQQAADAFLANEKGWQKSIADAIKLPLALVKKTVSAFGIETLKDEVENNPAGKSPAVARPQNNAMSYSYYGCDNPTYGCDSPTSRCGTNSTCGSCACATAGCNTAFCQSNNCGTGICVSYMKGPRATKALVPA
jgi:hypothetical protein